MCIGVWLKPVPGVGRFTQSGPPGGPNQTDRSQLTVTAGRPELPPARGARPDRPVTSHRPSIVCPTHVPG